MASFLRNGLCVLAFVFILILLVEVESSEALVTGQYRGENTTCETKSNAVLIFKVGDPALPMAVAFVPVPGSPVYREDAPVPGCSSLASLSDLGPDLEDDTRCYFRLRHVDGFLQFPYQELFRAGGPDPEPQPAGRLVPARKDVLVLDKMADRTAHCTYNFDRHFRLGQQGLVRAGNATFLRNLRGSLYRGRQRALV